MGRQTFDGRRTLIAGAGILIIALAAGIGASGQTALDLSQPPAKPSEDHKCPVCGMFVAQYPDFEAAAVFKDGATVFFDGAKDMFRYLFDVGTYARGRTRADIARVWVTDYYSLKWTDAKAALFVKGSDVLGPMGRELIPFAKETEAKEFLKDHKGKSLFRFAEIMPSVLKDID
ncbi:MAG TPA: nitrous oxide reductase accessory protein NosL [Acidobacteriota bacterium]|nr:nitrous oxide reductase accessory protein NosL [Acidobacteriota bacterium]